MKTRLGKKQQGAAAIEFALVFVIFFCGALWRAQLQLAPAVGAVIQQCDG